MCYYAKRNYMPNARLPCVKVRMKLDKLFDLAAFDTVLNFVTYNMSATLGCKLLKFGVRQYFFPLADRGHLGTPWVRFMVNVDSKFKAIK